jgi:hypothetical protein
LGGGGGGALLKRRTRILQWMFLCMTRMRTYALPCLSALPPPPTTKRRMAQQG